MTGIVGLTRTLTPSSTEDYSQDDFPDDALSEEEKSQWTIEKVLSSTDVSSAFWVFLARNHIAEILAFCHDVDRCSSQSLSHLHARAYLIARLPLNRYRKMIQSQMYGIHDQRDKLKAIFDEYLDKDAPSSIKISGPSMIKLSKYLNVDKFASSSLSTR